MCVVDLRMSTKETRSHLTKRSVRPITTQRIHSTLTAVLLTTLQSEVYIHGDKEVVSTNRLLAASYLSEKGHTSFLVCVPWPGVNPADSSPIVSRNGILAAPAPSYIRPVLSFPRPKYRRSTRHLTDLGI